jgi:hypothetical protein
LPLGGVAPRLAGVLLRCKMAIVACFNLIVILNLFQDNKLPLPVILKQVQDDEGELG